jgi:uroporphyrinogen decarboxylase
MPIEKPFKLGADFDHLRQVIMRETVDGPVPIIEMMADGSIMGEITGMEHPIDAMTELGELADPDEGNQQEALEKGLRFLELNVAFSKAVGYDSAWTIPIVPIPRTRALYSGSDEIAKARPWQNEHKGIIPDRETFESFKWATVDQIDLATLDYTSELLPPGMKMHVFYMGIFEDLRMIMGFEQMAIKSVDEPKLLGDILEQLTILAERAIDQSSVHPATGAIFYADDMGFNTSTMLSPAFYRKWLFPRLKRLADACHKHNKPFLFHSCGFVDTLMEDLIEFVGIDGFHSFQDSIMPIEEVYKKYGDRISILGGVDVGLLARGTPEQVRTRCRQILDTCGPNGGFAIGSGNSVTNYCKIENYYAMINEARKWNEEKGYL